MSVTRTLRWTTGVILFLPALALLVPAARAAAQGAVRGQVSIKERPGEMTEDLADAVIYLEPATRAKVRMTPRDTAMVLRSRNFTPRVRAVTPGSRIDFPNQDKFSHNVFSKAPGGAFDTDVFGRGRTKSNVFREPGVYPLYCNIHPRMTGFVLVLTTPYYTQAGEDGRFQLGGVPAGKYVLHVWHDRAPEVTRDVAVAPAGLEVSNVELDARGYKYVQHKNKFGQDYTNAAGDRY